MDIKAKVTKINSAIPTLKALASITIDDCFVVRNIKIIEGKNGLFFSMPTYKTNDGEYKDICFPINRETRQQISDAIFNEYNANQESIKEDDLPF